MRCIPLCLGLLLMNSAFSNSASATHTPEPAACTRAPPLASDFSYKLETVSDQLEYPWAMTFLPNHQMLITERPGRLRIVTQAGEVSAPIQGVPTVDNRDQGGLLDVLLAQDFADSRLIYLSFSEPRPNSQTSTTVARARLSEDETQLYDLEIIFRQLPAWTSTKHYGSRLVWDKSGFLYITLGERYLPEPRQLAQDLGTHLGKVVRVKPDGSVPPNNPFIHTAGEPEIWSYGHRNVQGAALHPRTGQLWISEQRPNGGDVINVPKAGRNYGWPVLTQDTNNIEPTLHENISQRDDLDEPAYCWDPNIAPAGITFYNGDAFPQWTNNLIISSLIPGGIVRLSLDGTRVTGEERLLKNLGPIRDVSEGPQGDLWLLTEEKKGRLLRLRP